MTKVDFKGHSLHYLNLDQRRQRTLLFINSLGTNFHIWDAVVEELKTDVNIVLFDKRGHGLSDFVEETQGLDDFADDAEGLIRILGLEKLVIVGLSVGGMIAQILANRIPERIEKMILSDTCYKIGTADKWNDRINSVRTAGLAQISEDVVSRWFSAQFREQNPDEVMKYTEMFINTQVSGYIKTCQAIRDANLKALTKQIETPALCVVGSEDQSTTVKEVQAMANLIRGSKFEIIENSGHLPCIDNPKVFVELIKKFVL